MVRVVYCVEDGIPLFPCEYCTEGDIALYMTMVIRNMAQIPPIDPILNPVDWWTDSTVVESKPTNEICINLGTFQDPMDNICGAQFVVKHVPNVETIYYQGGVGGTPAGLRYAWAKISRQTTATEACSLGAIGDVAEWALDITDTSFGTVPCANGWTDIPFIQSLSNYTGFAGSVVDLIPTTAAAFQTPLPP